MRFSCLLLSCVFPSDATTELAGPSGKALSVQADESAGRRFESQLISRQNGSHSCLSKGRKVPGFRIAGVVAARLRCGSCSGDDNKS